MSHKPMIAGAIGTAVASVARAGRVWFCMRNVSDNPSVAEIDETLARVEADKRRADLLKKHWIEVSPYDLQVLVNVAEQSKRDRPQ